MPKRPTGSANAVLQPGRTRHQRMADDLLTAHGFVFERRTGHGANLYRHPDGRTENVNGTPSNPGGEYARIKRRVRAGETTTEETEVSTTEISPVAQFVAMGDPFLLKAPRSLLEVKARQTALAGWVKRVMERHGPVLSADLVAASEQMGFKQRQIVQARKDAGVVAYVVPGEGKGKGRGKQVTYAALPHQVPENASIVGRPRSEPERNGVAVTEGEEPRQDALRVDTPSTIDESAGGDPTHPLNQSHETAGIVVGHDPIPEPPTTPASDDSEKPDAPREYVPGSIALASESDVAAAAFMLLESLGVKKPGDEARQALRNVRAELHQANGAIDSALAAVARALESLA